MVDLIKGRKLGALDPFTLFIAGGIFSAGMVMILMFSRVGLGDRATGIRTWLAGDILAFLGQASSIAGASSSRVGPTIEVIGITTGFLIGGLTFHWLAIRRHRGSQMTVRKMTITGISIGLATSGVYWLINDIGVGAKIFHILITLLLALPLPALVEPARRFWGARMLATVFVLGALFNLIMFFAGDPSFSLKEELAFGLLASLIISLLTSSALLLWCQEELAHRLTSLAISDALTGALNRRGLLPLLSRELALARRVGRPVSIVICDLDHFKKINDVYGHHAGDIVLKAFVSRAQAMLRTSDLVARWGGEEFMFVLPDTAIADAVAVVERLQRAQRPAAASLPQVTFSAGVSGTLGKEGPCDIDGLIALADEHLYIAKQKRNRVVCASQEATGDATSTMGISAPLFEEKARVAA